MPRLVTQILQAIRHRLASPARPVVEVYWHETGWVPAGPQRSALRVVRVVHGPNDFRYIVESKQESQT